MAITIALPTPHFEKLNATLQNAKLPADDREHIQEALNRYNGWVAALRAIDEPTVEETVAKMVSLLNAYRLFLDVEVIFDRTGDFLYRQKGQLKLDNSVLEEFLPHLVYQCAMKKEDMSGIALGPTTGFSAVYFTSSLAMQMPGGGMHVRTKDQDFAIGKRIYLQASHNANFADAVSRDFYLGYVVAECKTNLDKTMFQEACATAHDVKSAVTGSKYYLLCEWLDMTPQSTAATDVDEVIILRKAKRMSSNIRSSFGQAAGRQRDRHLLLDFLQKNPFCPQMFLRFINHIASLLSSDELIEDDVLQQGFF